MITLSDGTPIAKEQYNIIQPCTTKIPQKYETVQDYEQYLLNSIPLLFVDSLFLYQLPKGLVIYKDTPTTYRFATDHSSNEYVLSKSVNVVGLDIKSNYNILFATAIKQNQPEIFDHPENLMKYVCSFGHHGYITPKHQLCLCSSEYVVLSKK